MHSKQTVSAISHRKAKGIEYTSFGEIADKQLFLPEDRYPHLSIDQYAIMPNHIHAIMILKGESAGASPRPTITDIIRGREDYEEIVKYIYENPIRWYYDELYAEE